MFKSLKLIIFALVLSSATLYAQNARLQVIHNAVDVAAASVDIYLWNTVSDSLVVKLDDFAFRAATPFVDVPAGDDLDVIIAGPTSADETEQVIATIPVGALADGTVVNFALITDISDVVGNTVPTKFSLEQNYPNPFNPSTVISFSIPKAENVTLKIYNILGSEIATLLNEELNSGVYQVDFNAANLASGTYFYQINAGSFTEVRKMNLLK